MSVTGLNLQPGWLKRQMAESRAAAWPSVLLPLLHLNDGLLQKSNRKEERVPTSTIHLNPEELREVIIAGLKAKKFIPETAKLEPRDVFVQQITTGYFEDGRDYCCDVDVRA